MSELAVVSLSPDQSNAGSYGKLEFRRDLFAGLTVAAISLPQAMAYALIAGVDPRFGLYSAIVVTAIASIFGSSSHLINGPTNAISLVVFGALAFIDPDARLDAYEAMFLLAVMVGMLRRLLLPRLLSSTKGADDAIYRVRRGRDRRRDWSELTAGGLRSCADRARRACASAA